MFKSTKTYRLFSLIYLVLGLSFQTHASKDTQHPFVVSGVIINSGSADLIQRFTKYLSERADYPMRVVYVNEYSELSRTLKNNPDAVGWTCGAPYVQDSDSTGQQLVSVPLFNNKPTYHSLILSRRNRPEKELADFKGGILAYSDARSNSGFLSPKYALHKKGIDMNKHFRLLLNAGNHEGSIEALISGLADVAAIDEYVWLAYLRKNPGANKILHELERMGPFPFTPIVSGNKVNTETVSKLSSALLNMSNDEEGKKLLSEFYFDGFVNKKPEFYQPIKEMLSVVDIVSGN